MRGKKRKEKKEVEKMEWRVRERERQREKRIVTLFLYTRKAQNRRRIHRVVAVYPVTNGTEFRFANFVSIYDVEKYLEKFSRYRFERRSKETYIIIIIIRAIHNKRFSKNTFPLPLPVFVAMPL